jgi:hypothetical protein
MPQALIVVLGAVGAALVAKLIAKEWRRVNDELDRAQGEPATADVARETLPNLQRDPVTGEYRPGR